QRPAFVVGKGDGAPRGAVARRAATLDAAGAQGIIDEEDPALFRQEEAGLTLGNRGVVVKSDVPAPEFGFPPLRGDVLEQGGFARDFGEPEVGRRRRIDTPMGSHSSPSQRWPRCAAV